MTKRSHFKLPVKILIFSILVAVLAIVAGVALAVCVDQTGGVRPYILGNEVRHLPGPELRWFGTAETVLVVFAVAGLLCTLTPGTVVVYQYGKARRQRPNTSVLVGLHRELSAAPDTRSAVHTPDGVNTDFARKGWPHGLSFYFGSVLVCGIILMPVSWLRLAASFGGEPGIGVGLLLVVLPLRIFMVVVFCLLLHHAWQAIQPYEVRTTPGKAVGYCFIPFFNFYWVFQAVWGLAKDFNNRVIKERSFRVPPISEGVALWYCICTLAGLVPFVGLVTGLVAFILLLFFIRQVYHSIDGLHKAVSHLSPQIEQRVAPGHFGEHQQRRHSRRCIYVVPIVVLGAIISGWALWYLERTYLTPITPEGQQETAAAYEYVRDVDLALVDDELARRFGVALPDAGGQDLEKDLHTEKQDDGQVFTSVGGRTTGSTESAEVYSVKPGDTLFSIADKIYGDGSKWKVIHDANPELTRPDGLEVGMKLRIPTGSLPRMLELAASESITCKMMEPVLDQLRERCKGRLNVVSLDIQDDPTLAEQYRVKVVPTQIFLDPSGKELFRHEGFLSAEEIAAKWRELGFDLQALK